MKPFHVQLVAGEGRPLEVRFDDACRRLEAIERLHLELDGSFVWVSDRWQIEGMLYDRDECLQYVELKGTAPRPAWDTLLAVFIPSPGAGSLISLPSGDLYDLHTFESLLWSSTAQGSRQDGSGE